jgi:hypothetical protein
MHHPIPLKNMETNASQIMRKCQKLQVAPSNPCIKKSPSSFKKLGFYSFQAQMRKPNFP